MSPDEKLYPGSDFESDMTDQEAIEPDTTPAQSSEDTFGEQITPDETDKEEISDSDQVGAETPLDQLRDEQNY